MKMRVLLGSATVGLASVVLMGVSMPAFAVPMPSPATFVDCADLGVDNHVDGQLYCLSTTDKFNDEGGQANINDILDNGTLNPLFGGTEAWMELGVYPDDDPVMFILNPDGSVNGDEGNNLISGAVGIANIVFELYDEVMLFFKDGNFGHTGVIIGPGGYADVLGPATNSGLIGLSNTFSGGGSTSCIIIGPCYGGDFDHMIPPGTGEQGAISHINLWVRGAQQVPEPGTLMLLGIGLLGLGLARRRPA